MPELLHSHAAALPRKSISLPRFTKMIRSQRSAAHLHLLFRGPSLLLLSVLLRWWRWWRYIGLHLACFNPLGLHKACLFDDLSSEELGDGSDGCADHSWDGLGDCSVDDLFIVSVDSSIEARKLTLLTTDSDNLAARHNS